MPLKDPEARRAYQKQWRDANQQWTTAWRSSNRLAIAEYHRTHYKANREENRRKHRAYYIAHRESVNARLKANKLKFPSRWKEYQNNYNATPKAVLARKLWVKNNPETVKAARRLWTERNRHKTLQYRSKRRAIQYRATIGDISVITRWTKRWRASSAVVCYWCLEVFTPRECASDHIIPLDGNGPHSIENLCISCRTCNVKKHTKSLNEWNRLIANPVLL